MDITLIVVIGIIIIIIIEMLSIQHLSKQGYKVLHNTKQETNSNQQNSVR